MKRVLSANMNFQDESGRIWGIETDNIFAGEDVMLFDGAFIAEAKIEQDEHGSLVAKVRQLTRVEDFSAIPEKYSQRTLMH